MERKLVNLVKHALQFIYIVGFIMAISLPASATNIAVGNYSFEDPALSTPGTWTESINGWIITGDSGYFGAGVWLPTAAQTSTAFVEGIPDGFQVGWSNGGDITQTVPANLTPGHRYTLSVWIGGRSGLSGIDYAFILAGDSTLISQKTGVNYADEWIQETITYTSLPGDVNAGKPLAIKLINTEGIQLNFDKVTLDEAFVLTCTGFLPPFDKPLTLKRKNNRVIPVKMVLHDLFGNIITDADITTPPLINVTYDTNETITGYDSDLVPAGLSDVGNAFRYDPREQVWIINLETNQFTASGVYTVTVKPGDDSYVIEGCSQTFTRLP